MSDEPQNGSGQDDGYEVLREDNLKAMRLLAVPFFRGRNRRINEHWDEQVAPVIKIGIETRDATAELAGDANALRLYDQHLVVRALTLSSASPASGVSYDDAVAFLQELNRQSSDLWRPGELVLQPKDFPDAYRSESPDGPAESPEPERPSVWQERQEPEDGPKSSLMRRALFVSSAIVAGLLLGILLFSLVRREESQAGSDGVQNAQSAPATAGDLAETESRLSGRIDQVSARVEQVDDRVDGVVTEVNALKASSSAASRRPASQPASPRNCGSSRPWSYQPSNPKGSLRLEPC